MENKIRVLCTIKKWVFLVTGNALVLQLKFGKKLLTAQNIGVISGKFNVV